MDRSEIRRRLQQARIPLMIMAIALLLLLSTGKGSASHEDLSQSQSDAVHSSLPEDELRLTETLQAIEGVGKVRVLLSVEVSAQTDYLTDAEKTVILSSGSGKQQALAFRTRCPLYLGAVIVCEGGDDPNTQWKVLDAVSTFTGLRADRITVLKLQGS